MKGRSAPIHPVSTIAFTCERNSDGNEFFTEKEKYSTFLSRRENVQIPSNAEQITRYLHLINTESARIRTRGYRSRCYSIEKG